VIGGIKIIAQERMRDALVMNGIQSSEIFLVSRDRSITLTP